MDGLGLDNVYNSFSYGKPKRNHNDDCWIQYEIYRYLNNIPINNQVAVAVAQSVRVFVSHAEGREFESQPET